MIHSVNEPDAIVFIHDLNDVCIHIKGHFLSEDIFNLPFVIFKNDFRRLVDHLNTSPEGCQRHVLGAAVKQNHIRSSYHFHKQGLHIIHIDLKGAGIYCNDLLHQSPILWKLHFFKFADLPHTVVFYDHTFRLIKSIIGYQPLRSQILKFIDHLYTGPAFLQLLRIKFNFAFFTEDQQRRAVYLKIVLLNGKIQESGLAAFQKSCHKIYRNSDFFFHIFSQSLLYNVIRKRALQAYPLQAWSR